MIQRLLLLSCLLVVTGIAGARVTVQDINNLDGLRMVRVEVEIYEIAYTKGSDFGIDWRWTSFADTDFLGSVAKFPIDLSEQGNISLSALDTRYGILTATIQAAVEKGHARLLSKPTIVTRDGQAAQVASGEQIPFTVMSSLGSQLPQNMDTQYRQTGVALQVTPRILPANSVVIDGTPRTITKIAMQLRPSVSDISRIERLSYAVGANKKVYDLPVVAQRAVETLVIARDGQTLVLGGLLEERHRENEKGVPYLKDIPVLGHAFKSSKERTVTTEIIMYVTPYIMDPGKEYREERAQQVAQTDAARANAALVDHTAAENQQQAEADPATPTPLSVRDHVVVEDSRTFVETGGKTPFLGRNNKIVAVGQVLNRSPQKVRDVHVEAALYDDLGNLIDVVTQKVGRLGSGQERNFRIEFGNFDDNFNNAYIAHRVEYMTYYNY